MKKPVVVSVGLWFQLSLVSAQQLVVTQRGFADNLTASLYENVNECTSSLGVSMAFSLVYPSMINDSKCQVENVFGFPGDQSQLVWNDTTTQLNSMYPEVNCSAGELCMPTVIISNAVWVDNQTTALNSTFSNLLQDLLIPIAFTDNGAGDHVNAWVNTTTRGLIPELVNSGPLEGFLLAVNTIYLKARWLSTFYAAQTNQDTFYASSERATTVSDTALFMHQVENLFYSDSAVKGFQLAKMPFLGDTLSMFIALPTSNASGRIDSTTLVNAIPALQDTRIAMALPKFDFESTYQDNLKASLRKLGVTAPFISGLCILENDCSPFISKIIQKTVISVDEDGVKAAAATAISVVTSIRVNETEPILFLADHPFQFFIYEQDTELVLFEGVVGNPVAPADTASPGLAATHNESDFWTSHFGVNPLVVANNTTTTATTTNASKSSGATLVSSSSSLPSRDIISSSVVASALFMGLARLVT